MSTAAVQLDYYKVLGLTKDAPSEDGACSHFVFIAHIEPFRSATRIQAEGVGNPPR
jgi:hypothetical protein